MRYFLGKKLSIPGEKLKELLNLCPRTENYLPIRAYLSCLLMKSKTLNKHLMPVVNGNKPTDLGEITKIYHDYKNAFFSKIEKALVMPVLEDIICDNSLKVYVIDFDCIGFDIHKTKRKNYC